MAGFLYLVPGTRGTINQRNLPKSLNHLRDTRIFGSSYANNGPGGRGGVVFTVASKLESSPKTGYYPDAQRWICLGDESDPDTPWVGVEIDNPPVPSDLEREDVLPFNIVKLKDDNDWKIPIARYVPQSFWVTPEGVEKREDARFSWIAKQSEKWREQLYGTGDGQLTDADGFKYAVNMLSVNYYLGLYEAANLLDLVAPLHVVRIVDAVCDFEAILAELESQKKTVSTPRGGSTLTPGDKG